MPGAATQDQTYTITDFTPGIHRWARPGIPGNYPLSSPPGSAAHTYRCIGKEEVGLIPLPTYQVAQTYTHGADAANPLCVSLGNMLSLTPRGGAVADIVSAFLVQHGGGTGAATEFNVTRLPVTFSSFAPIVVYNSAASQFPINTTSWPIMDFGVWKDPSTGIFARTVITTDPISTSFNTTTGNNGKWVTVRGWTTPTPTTAPESSNGTFPLIGLIGSYPRVFYHATRMGIWQVGASQTVTNNFVASDSDVLSVSGQFNPTTNTVVGTFFAEMGTLVGCWGSWSTGEFVGIYQEGGAFLIYGDLLLPPQTIYKLSGVMGTAGSVGPGALTPTGMIYPRLNEAVYSWNGDNISQNISRQVPDGVFTRTAVPAPFAGASGNLTASTSTVRWGEWVVFPNNWLYNTSTQSWWLMEDPTVINFQVHAQATLNNLLSSPGIATSAINQPCSLNTYYWDKTTAVSSWFWQSNPIPATVGNLVTLVSVEIVATNLSATPATIAVQPVSPSQPYVTTPLQDQTTSLVYFTIPPGTSGYRARQRIGHTDYNIQLAITAANTNTNNAAPTLHTISCDYTTTRPSGV